VTAAAKLRLLFGSHKFLPFFLYFLTYSIGCSHQFLVITHSFACQRHQNDGHQWQASAKVNLGFSLRIFQADDSEEHQQVIDIPQYREKQANVTQVDLQLTILIHKDRNQRYHSRYGAQQKQRDASGV